MTLYAHAIDVSEQSDALRIAVLICRGLQDADESPSATDAFSPRAAATAEASKAVVLMFIPFSPRLMSPTQWNMPRPLLFLISARQFDVEPRQCAHLFTMLKNPPVITFKALVTISLVDSRALINHSLQKQQFHGNTIDLKRVSCMHDWKSKMQAATRCKLDSTKNETENCASHDFDVL